MHETFYCIREVGDRKKQPNLIHKDNYIYLLAPLISQVNILSV